MSSAIRITHNVPAANAFQEWNVKEAFPQFCVTFRTDDLHVTLLIEARYTYADSLVVNRIKIGKVETQLSLEQTRTIMNTITLDRLESEFCGTMLERRAEDMWEVLFDNF